MVSKLLFNYSRFLLVAACSFLLCSCDKAVTPDLKTDVQAVKGGKYSLDKDHASLIFKLNHLGFSTYVARFNTMEASLDFDPENIEKSSLEVIVDMASIDVNNTAFAEQLRGSDWLDTAQFPKATFKTTPLRRIDRQEHFCVRRRPDVPWRDEADHTQRDLSRWRPQHAHAQEYARLLGQHDLQAIGFRGRQVHFDGHRR